MPLTDPPSDLRGFPVWTLSVEQPLARIHRIGNDPRFFGASGDYRFDLPLPRGTFYAAETAAGSFIEVFRAVPLVAQAELDARLLANVRVPDERRLADCTDAQARRFGITAEIHSTPDYAICQRWALALADAGLAGIRYLVRHDPSASEVGIALFGGEGVDGSLIVDEDWPIPPSVVEGVRSRFGVLVLPSPSKAG